VIIGSLSIKEDDDGDDGTITFLFCFIKILIYLHGHYSFANFDDISLTSKAIRKIVFASEQNTRFFWCLLLRPPLS